MCAQYTWQNDEQLGTPSWKRGFLALGGAASFTGALGVVMAAKLRYSNFLWGLINTTTYGLVAWAYAYGGDAQLNLAFFNFMQVRGRGVGGGGG